MKYIKKYANYIAAAILGLMFILMVSSMRKDSAIRDEMPHIVAGYSYLTQFDYRINPEHPPLIKQLSALPLLFMDINFPSNDPAWRDNVNDQWSLGDTFLYRSDNDADKMIFWGRLPIVILTIITAFVIYLWSKKLFKSKLAGLIALTLFAFSPNIMAHGRFITTDMGITSFSVFALYFWWVFLKTPNWKNFIIASIFQGLMHLSKFSSPLFLPVIVVMAILAIFAYNKKWSFKTRAKIYLGATVLSSVIALFMIGVWYQVFIHQMPLETQKQLIAESINDSQFDNAGLATKLTGLANNPILRPYSQYFLGFFMVFAHAKYGHSTYFLGEVGQNWPHYYFVAYLLKEPITSQILFFSSLVIFSVFIVKIIKNKDKKRLFKYFQKYYPLIPFVCLIIGFLYIGMTAKLQLGIRYIVPIFPYLYIIIAGIIALYVKKIIKRSDKKSVLNYKIAKFSGTFLALWLILANFIIYPHYLAYFNEYIGGYKNGWKYMIDSNLDWGQDLRRLKAYLDENNIQNVKVDYFGGGNLDYYLGADNYTLWGYDKGPTTGWIAISVNAIQWNSANEDGRLSYHWLTDNHEPVKKIGGSIFVYHIKE
jgi:hypothetical protein